MNLQTIKNIFSKKETVIDEPIETNNLTVIDKPIVFHRNYSLQWAINKAYDRNGFQRESALKDLLIKHPNQPETLMVLLRLQNDYVDVIRNQAYQGLTLWLIAENLPILLENTHHFLHLQNQSRSNSDIINALTDLYFHQNHQQVVLRFLKKRQGKAVRAVFQLLQSSQISSDNIVTIALSSPDIVINMSVWEDLQVMSVDEKLSLLALSPKRHIKNSQFYFKLMLSLIYKQPLVVWQTLVINYLRYATSSQIYTLMFFLRREGVDFWQVIDELIVKIGETNTSELALKIIIKNGLIDELKQVNDKYPQWLHWHTEIILTAMLILMPDDGKTWQLCEKHQDDLDFAQENKTKIIYHTKLYNLSDLYQYQILLDLSKSEMIAYSDTLPLWEQFLFVIELIQKEGLDKNSQLLTQIKAKIKTKVLIRDKTIKLTQKEIIMSFLQDETHKSYFDDIKTELEWFKLM